MEWAFPSVLILSLAFAAGCAAHKHSLSSDSPFRRIDSITVVPPVDARVDKKSKVDLEKHVRQNAQKQLLKKGYPVVLTEVTGYHGELGVEDFKDAGPDFIKDVGPAESHWILVLCVEDISSKLTFGSTGNAAISGFLFSKAEGRTMWSGKGLGQVGQGGLVGMMMKGAMDEGAVDAAVANLLATIPSR